MTAIEIHLDGIKYFVQLDFGSPYSEVYKGAVKIWLFIGTLRSDHVYSEKILFWYKEQASNYMITYSKIEAKKFINRALSKLAT